MSRPAASRRASSDPIRSWVVRECASACAEPSRRDASSDCEALADRAIWGEGEWRKSEDFHAVQNIHPNQTTIQTKQPPNQTTIQTIQTNSKQPPHLCGCKGDLGLLLRFGSGLPSRLSRVGSRSQAVLVFNHELKRERLGVIPTRQAKKGGDAGKREGK